MPEPDEDVIAPPPMRGRGPAAAPGQRLEVPANRFGDLVKTGFGLGIGIALAFMVVSGLLWLLAAILVASAFS